MRKILFTALLTLILILGLVGSALAQGGTVHYVQRGENLSAIAVIYGLTPQAIMAANGLQNPDFIYVGQKLTIPSIGNIGNIGNSNSTAGYYTVRAGDTLNIIAQQLNTTAQALATANNLGNSDVIYVGQVLNVPGGSGYAPQYPSPSHQACNRYYVVQWGDTLSGLAWHHGTTVKAILAVNTLYSDAIQEGQKLCLPGGSGTYTPHQAYYHTVKAGDTVAAIAYRYGVSQAAIIQANNLSDSGLIRVGQKLGIPGYTPQPAKTPQPASKKPHHKKPAPPPPTYTQHDGPYDQISCFWPIDVWVDREHEIVEAVNTWCAISDQIDDPNSMTSIVVRTMGQEGTKIKIQRGNEAPRDFWVGDSPGFGPEFLWYPTVPGYYRVWVGAEEPSEVVEFDLPPGKRAWLDFHLTSVSENPRPRVTSGWSGKVTQNASQVTPQNGVSSVIIIRTPAQGLPIRIRSEGSFTALCYTGQKPELGMGACEFGGLWPGKYTLILEGAGISVEIFVDGVETAEVTFDAQ